jgi:2-polyprenyl-3-methyl-5-hydroxy-6-metoxy-1,4-benzoquinol methylase
LKGNCLSDSVSYTPRQLSEIAQSFSGQLGFAKRFIMKYRPYICPFHVLAGFVNDNDSLLDIGCGAGLWINLLNRLGLVNSAVGVDVDENAVSVARGITPADCDIRYFAQSANQQWPIGNFDVVSAIDVLHHVPVDEQRNFIGKLVNVQANRIIFKDIEPARRFRACMNTLHDIVMTGQVPKYRNAQQVRKWFLEEGCKIETEGFVNMLWYPHYYIIASK